MDLRRIMKQVFPAGCGIRKNGFLQGIVCSFMVELAGRLDESAPEKISIVWNELLLLQAIIGRKITVATINCRFANRTWFP